MIGMPTTAPASALSPMLSLARNTRRLTTSDASAISQLSNPPTQGNRKDDHPDQAEVEANNKTGRDHGNTCGHDRWPDRWSRQVDHRMRAFRMGRQFGT